MSLSLSPPHSPALSRRSALTTRMRTPKRVARDLSEWRRRAITFVWAIAETLRFGAAGISDIIINAVAGTDVSDV